MPSIKDFEKKAKEAKAKNTEEDSSGLDLNLKKSKSNSSRRRPGRDTEANLESDKESKEESNSESRTEASADHNHSSEPEEVPLRAEFEVSGESSLEANDQEGLSDSTNEESTSDSTNEAGTEEAFAEKTESPFSKIYVHVPGTDVTLKFDTPEKVVEIADSVVEDWKNDGSFNSIPLGNPVAQMLAAKGLRKAKDIEKKLEEKGVFIMAQMGVDYIKSKLKK